MEGLLQSIMGGIGVGAIYALLGLSFALLFGRLTICSYMNGDLSILAAYACFNLHSSWGLDPFVTMLMLCPIYFGLGYLVQTVFMKPFMKLEVWQGRYQGQVMVTWGLGMFIMAIEYISWSATYRTTGVSYRNSAFQIGNIFVSYVNVFSLIAILVIVVSLKLLLKRTHLGISLRACSYNRVSAMLSGVNYNKVCATAFGISGVLSVVAGTFYALTSQITPAAGMELTFKGWMAVIIGGMGSLGGTVVAGLLMGVIEAVTSFYWVPALKEVVLFILLLIFLVLKPAGIAKRKQL